MTNPNQVKGSVTERMVVKYLREQGFPEADRRLREGRTDDQGDIDGVPFTTIQVKYVTHQRYAMWVVDTVRQRDRASNPYCLLVRRIPQKPVSQWEASAPSFWLAGDPARHLPEEEAWTWVRMDLRLAVTLLRQMVQVASPSAPSLPTT